MLGKPPSTGYLKAGRCLSLLLKAFTGMDEDFRQIKDEEEFKDWDKIQQYLNSEQGEQQVKHLQQLRFFCDHESSKIDRDTLLKVLRKQVFSYTLATDGSLQEIDLESPRVKNTPLKSFFCLAYFAMTYVTLQDLIVE